VYVRGGHRLGLLGGIEERSDLLGEEIRIASRDRCFLLLFELSEEATTAVAILAPGGQLRNRVELQMVGAVERTQVRDQFFLIARREERGDQNDVRDGRVDRRNGGVARIDEHQIRVDLVLDDALEDRPLPDV
jgi:hypothetical protein